MGAEGVEVVVPALRAQGSRLAEERGERGQRPHRESSTRGTVFKNRVHWL